jgi:hypothetical protein
MSYVKIKQELAAAKAEYNAKCNDLPPAGERELSNKVRELNDKLIAALTAGALPCPMCGNPVHGMEQPGSRGSVEFEIGCVPCRPFVWTDGTVRNACVRGGLLPRHAVEAWNAGPNQWQLNKDQNTDPKTRSFQPPHPQSLGPAPKADMFDGAPRGS